MRDVRCRIRPGIPAQTSEVIRGTSVWARAWALLYIRVADATHHEHLHYNITLPFYKETA